MNNTASVLLEAGTAYISQAPEFNPASGLFGGVRGGHF